MRLQGKALRTGSLGIALALLTAGSLAAQDIEDPCPTNGTWADCLADRLNRIETLKGVLQQEKPEIQATSSKASALEDVGAGILPRLIGAATGSEINLEDTLSSLLANLDVDGLENTDGGMRFKKNFQVTYGTLAVDLAAKKGELFPELKMKLEGQEQKDLIDTLNGELKDFDDLDLNLTFSVDRSGAKKKIWWGRRYRLSNGGGKTGNGLAADTLFDQVQTYIVNLPKTLNQVSKKFNEALQTHAVDANKKVLSVRKTPEANRKAIQDTLEPLVEAEKVNFNSFAGVLKSMRYFDFSKLVANQPQFVVSVGRSFRDELVGRDSWKASVKYEVGQANVNGLRRICPALEATCYKNFVENQDKALQKNWRGALNASYTWVDDYDYASPDGAVTLMLKESETWDASLSAGRTLRFIDDPDDPSQKLELTRFDLEAAFEEASGDTQKQSRFVSTATFTQRINAGLSLAVGVVYANRPEFRGEVDEEFSARAGLKVSLQPKKDK